MADRTPSILRCIATLDRRFVAANLAANGVSGADYTQAGPMPGVPVAAQRGLARLNSSGEMAADTTIETYTVHGGSAGDARISWRYLGDALWRGWDPPVTIAQFEFLDRDATAYAWRDPHIASRPDGYSFIAVQGAQRYVQLWRRARGATSFSMTTIYDAGSAVYTGANRACPCIVALPNDRLLCLFWALVGGSGGIHSAYSDDDGVTWSTPQLLEEVIGTFGAEPVRIRAAYLNGQVLMLVHIVATIDTLVQFASADGGCSFTLISLAVVERRGYWEVVASGGEFVCAAIATDAASTGATVVPYVRRIGAAFTALSSATEVLACSDSATAEWGSRGAGPDYLILDSDLSLCVDSFGALRLYGRTPTTGLVFSTLSTDGGLTWSTAGSTWIGADTATHPAAFSAVGQGGRVLMASTFAANPGAADDSLCIFALGGSTSVPLPQSSPGTASEGRTCRYTTTWLPFDLPPATGGTWTLVTGGAGAAAFTGLGLRCQGGAGADYVNWTAALSTTNTEGIVAEAEIRVTDGTGYLLAQISAAGPLTFQARVAVSATSIVLRDMAGAANVASISTTAGTTGVHVKLGLGDDVGGVGNIGKVYAWYRPSGLGADQEWILIGSTSTLVQGAAVTGDLVTFGTFSAGATDVYFRHVAYAEGSSAGDYYNGQANPAGLLGQLASATPAPVAETGVYLSLSGSNTIIGEQWTIATTYAYPLTRIDPTASPSPDAQWRSTSDGQNVSIVFDLTDSQAVRSAFYAVYLDGANFSGGAWEGYDGAAWVALGTVDLQIGSSLKYTRSGPLIRCDPSGGSACADHIANEALVGATFKFGAGGIYRKIQSNSGGRWSPTSTAGLIQRPIIVLDAYDAADPASGTGGAIYSPRGALVLRGQTTGYTRYRLYITSQDTADGYYTLGTLAVMPITPIGNHDFRDYGIETNVQTDVNRKGSRRKTRLGRPYRYVQLAWPDGIDTSGTHDTSPDYVRDYTGGDVVGSPAQVPSDILGLVCENDTTPVLYLPSVSVPSSVGNTMITAADLMLYADVSTETLQIGVVLGDEHSGASSGELVRVGTVRLDEVL